MTFVNSKLRATFAIRKNNDFLEEWQTCLPITRIKWIIIRGVAEWSIAAVLKTVVPRGTGGSNPSSSAKEKPGA
jgi:hypothetical protein